MEKIKRKKYIINKRFQGEYVFHFFALISIGALLFTLFYLMATVETWMIIYDNHDAQPGSTPFILVKELVKSNWILILLGAIVTLVLAVFYSHRIAGPLHKFEIILGDMRSGILDPKCKLRHKDEAQGVMEQLQQTNRFFADKVNELRSIAEKLNETAESDGQSKEALINEIAKLQAIIDGFTIKE